MARHYLWEMCINLVGNIPNLYDKRSNKTWDSGQAVCAEVYGTDWMHNKDFIEMDIRDSSEPPPNVFVAACIKMANGYVPDWASKG